MTTEYAVQLRYSDGRTAVGAPSSLAYCRLAVKSQASDKAAWNPRAVAVLRREVGAWELFDETPEAVS